MVIKEEYLKAEDGKHVSAAADLVLKTMGYEETKKRFDFLAKKESSAQMMMNGPC